MNPIVSSKPILNFADDQPIPDPQYLVDLLTCPTEIREIIVTYLNEEDQGYLACQEEEYYPVLKKILSKLDYSLPRIIPYEQVNRLKYFKDMCGELETQKWYWQENLIESRNLDSAKVDKLQILAQNLKTLKRDIGIVKVSATKGVLPFEKTFLKDLNQVLIDLLIKAKVHDTLDILVEVRESIMKRINVKCKDEYDKKMEVSYKFQIDLVDQTIAYVVTSALRHFSNLSQCLALSLLPPADTARLEPEKTKDNSYVSIDEIFDEIFIEIQKDVPLNEKFISLIKDINAVQSGRTPLMAAAELGNPVIVRQLLKAKASVNKAINDEYPLMCACRSHSPLSGLVVQYLLEAGAIASLENANNMTALDVAIANNNEKAILALRKYGDTAVHLEIAEKLSKNKKTTQSEKLESKEEDWGDPEDASGWD